MTNPCNGLPCYITPPLSDSHTVTIENMVATLWPPMGQAALVGQFHSLPTLPRIVNMSMRGDSKLTPPAAVPASAAYDPPSAACSPLQQVLLQVHVVLHLMHTVTPS